MMESAKKSEKCLNCLGSGEIILETSPTWTRSDQCPACLGKGKETFYRIYANVRKGLDLYAIVDFSQGEDGMRLIGNYASIEIADAAATEEGLVKLPMYLQNQMDN